jgi:hypothetical protein
MFRIFGEIQHSVAMRSCCCNRCRIAAHRWCFLIRSTAKRSTNSSTATKARVRKAALGCRRCPATISTLVVAKRPEGCGRVAICCNGPTLLGFARLITYESAMYSSVLTSSLGTANAWATATGRGGAVVFCWCCKSRHWPRKAPGTITAFRTDGRKKIDRKVHPHVKPIGLIRKLIGAVTRPGDLVVDPAAGSFVVMYAAHQLGRDFMGCDLVYDFSQPHFPWRDG